MKFIKANMSFHFQFSHFILNELIHKLLYLTKYVIKFINASMFFFNLSYVTNFIAVNILIQYLL